MAWLISTFHHPITGNLITKGILTDSAALKSEEYLLVVGLSIEFLSGIFLANSCCYFLYLVDFLYSSLHADRAWADLPDRLREMVSTQQI